MKKIVLNTREIMIILDIGRSSSYNIVNHIKGLYPSSNQLTGSKVLIKDFTSFYGISIEDVKACILDPSFYRSINERI